jgi:hypothetical protein
MLVSKGRHPKSDVAAALDRAVAAGLNVVYSKNGHRWGWVICLTCKLRITVHGTPRSDGNEANRVDRFARRHCH